MTDIITRLEAVSGDNRNDCIVCDTTAAAVDEIIRLRQWVDTLAGALSNVTAHHVLSGHTMRLLADILKNGHLTEQTRDQLADNGALTMWMENHV